MTRDQITFVLEQFHAYRRLQGHEGRPLKLEVLTQGIITYGEFTGLHSDLGLLLLVTKLDPMVYLDFAHISRISLAEIGEADV